ASLNCRACASCHAHLDHVRLPRRQPDVVAADAPRERLSGQELASVERRWEAEGNRDDADTLALCVRVDVDDDDDVVLRERDELVVLGLEPVEALDALE